MALGTVKNIIIGAASLYISNDVLADNTVKPAYGAGSYRDVLDAGTFDGAETDGSSADAWKPAGFTMEGLEISYEPDYGDVEVDQLLGSAVIFKQSMRVSLNTTLAEATLYNLMLAWGQSSSTLTSTASTADLDIEGGSLGEAPVERSVIAVGNAPRIDSTQTAYDERVYHCYRTLNVEQSSHSMKRNESTGIPVSLRALPADSGLYGTIKDRKKTW